MRAIKGACPPCRQDQMPPMGDDNVAIGRQPIDRLLGQAFHAPNTRGRGQADQVRCGIDAGGGWHLQQTLNEVASGQRSSDPSQCRVVDAAQRPTASMGKPWYARCWPGSEESHASVRWSGCRRLKKKIVAGLAASEKCSSPSVFSTSTGSKDCFSAWVFETTRPYAVIDERVCKNFVRATAVP